ncbi:type VI secretion system accessory protein TagJ [Frigidibacter sp. ROC022]|uniref:type VI secretion system accessory protein TagJ n=1 Tax=Frigidibacter sp. ROC022 TaxID=2971796 RepID=UPI00215B633E|nr:type VI secretion system accessory protein TagJ [Frigidibacter sp. ROC022]MCR8723327.1 virulence protein SciE type [Frigidibacter sp. ROC022]
MTPEEHLRSGDLDAALAALQDRIRANPAEVKLRIFLFQLLCVLGDWKRAINQLKVCGELSPAALPMCQTYREAIICEVYREKVFAGEKEPLVFGDPSEWMAHLMEALKLLAQGHPDDAAKLRDKAFDAAPASPGMINGEKFEWISDADMRLGPCFEAIVNGRYFWVPFSRVKQLDFEAPTDLRDAIWMPATLTLPNEGQVVALLPTRYPGTERTGTAAEKLSRATSWTDAGAETFVGSGQRLWTTDNNEVPLMEARSLTIVGAEAEAEPAAPDESGENG